HKPQCVLNREHEELLPISAFRKDQWHRIIGIEKSSCPSSRDCSTEDALLLRFVLSHQVSDNSSERHLTNGIEPPERECFLDVSREDLAAPYRNQRTQDPVVSRAPPPHLWTMPLLSARSVTKRYPGVTALDSLTLELEPGIIGLVGANGAGKSTFIRILLGLLAPTSGSVEVLGIDSLAHPLEARKTIGYLPEHDCLPIDVSPADFVPHMGRMSGLPASAARERAAETLRHVGVHEERSLHIGSYST